MKVFFLILPLIFALACKTKNDIKKEAEFEKLKQDFVSVKGDKADYDQFREETRTDIARLSSVIDEHAQFERQQREDVKKDQSAVEARIHALEQKIAAMEEAKAKEDKERKERDAEPPPPKEGLEAGKKLMEEGKFEDAIEALRPSAKGKGKGVETRQAQFLLAEAHFTMKDYPGAALEYSDYRKRFSTDSLVPNCIYRLANCFRLMNKNKEAKLFYQELIEKYPKSKLIAKVKSEMKKLK